MQTGFSTGFQPPLLDEVIAQLNEATRLDPNFVHAHVNLALALAAADQQAEAIQHAARALELAPDRAGELRDQLGPDLLADAHCARGAVLANQGDFPAAEKHYRAAVELRPDHDRAPNNLGVVLMNLGQTDEAIHWFEEALLSDPKYAEAKANLDKARQVQNEQRKRE
jgi:tetratricopeptide (TPR) repeat protein